MINLTELAVCDHIVDLFNRKLISVANADIKYLAAALRLVCHLAGKGIVYRYGLFAKNVLPVAKGVHSYGIVRIVGGKHKYRIHLGIVKRYVVIGDYLFNFRELFFRSFRFFNQ